MAHYDCWNCGKSRYEYPNCCEETKHEYIDSQVRKWAREKAVERFRKKHEKEISDLAEEIMKNEDPYNDPWFKNYIKEIR